MESKRCCASSNKKQPIIKVEERVSVPFLSLGALSNTSCRKNATAPGLSTSGTRYSYVRRRPLPGEITDLILSMLPLDELALLYHECKGAREAVAKYIARTPTVTFHTVTPPVLVLLSKAASVVECRALVTPTTWDTLLPVTESALSKVIVRRRPFFQRLHAPEHYLTNRLVHELTMCPLLTDFTPPSTFALEKFVRERVKGARGLYVLDCHMIPTWSNKTVCMRAVRLACRQSRDTLLHLMLPTYISPKYVLSLFGPEETVTAGHRHDTREGVTGRPLLKETERFASEDRKEEIKTSRAFQKFLPQRLQRLDTRVFNLEVARSIVHYCGRSLLHLVIRMPEFNILFKTKNIDSMPPSTIDRCLSIVAAHTPRLQTLDVSAPFGLSPSLAKEMVDGWRSMKEMSLHCMWATIDAVGVLFEMRKLHILNVTAVYSIFYNAVDPLMPQLQAMPQDYYTAEHSVAEPLEPSSVEHLSAIEPLDEVKGQTLHSPSSVGKDDAVRRKTLLSETSRVYCKSEAVVHTTYTPPILERRNLRRLNLHFICPLRGEWNAYSNSDPPYFSVTTHPLQVNHDTKTWTPLDYTRAHFAGRLHMDYVARAFPCIEHLVARGIMLECGAANNDFTLPCLRHLVATTYQWTTPQLTCLFQASSRLEYLMLYGMSRARCIGALQYAPIGVKNLRIEYADGNYDLVHDICESKGQTAILSENAAPFGGVARNNRAAHDNGSIAMFIHSSDTGVTTTGGATTGVAATGIVVRAGTRRRIPEGCLTVCMLLFGLCAIAIILFILITTM